MEIWKGAEIFPKFQVLDIYELRLFSMNYQEWQNKSKAKNEMLK